MSSLKQIKQAEKALSRQQQVVREFNLLVGDIQRCEKTIRELQAELESINARYPGQRTTREDVAYLSDLLKCAQRKLAWEKSIASMQKRTPSLLQELATLMNDPENPPGDQAKAEMLDALQSLQGAMERLQNVKPA